MEEDFGMDSGGFRGRTEEERKRRNARGGMEEEDWKRRNGRAEWQMRIARGGMKEE